MKKSILIITLLLSFNAFSIKGESTQNYVQVCTNVVGDGSNINVVGDGSNVSVVGDGSNVNVVGDGSNVSVVGDGSNVDVVGDGSNIYCQVLPVNN